MKLDYLTLLSYEPVTFDGICSVRAPLLKDIAKIGYDVYLKYLGILLMDKESYYNRIDTLGDSYFENLEAADKAAILQTKKQYEVLTEQEKAKLSFFDVMTFDPMLRESVSLALNFFLTDNIVFDNGRIAFAACSGNTDANGRQIVTGYIYSGNYDFIVDIILQRADVKHPDEASDTTRVKNQTAAKLLEKIKSGNSQKRNSDDKKMELANIISALSSHHKSINITNIWNLTVYQLYDQFIRQRVDDSYDIQSMSVAAWGNSEGRFDDTQWFSLIHKN